MISIIFPLTRLFCRSRLFEGLARQDSRSPMNVTFRAKTNEMNAEFIKAAEQNRIVSIGGYHAVGGMRASLYNAMPVEGGEIFGEAYGWF